MSGKASNTPPASLRASMVAGHDGGDAGLIPQHQQLRGGPLGVHAVLLPQRIQYVLHQHVCWAQVLNDVKKGIHLPIPEAPGTAGAVILSLEYFMHQDVLLILLLTMRMLKRSEHSKHKPGV